MKNKKGLKILSLILILIATFSIILSSKLLKRTSFGIGDIEISIKPELQKYINYYLTEEDNGTLVQYGIETQVKSEEEENKRQIEVAFNQIEGKYPKEVKVITKSDVERQCEYDKTTGKLKIQSLGNEYIVICYYDTYTDENKQRELDAKITVKSTISKEEEIKNTVTENIGELTTIKHESQEIYNGYIKSNIINGTNYTTKYDEIEQIMISKKEAQNTLELEEAENFMNQEAKIVYKSSKIQKSVIDEVLGEEGKIEFIDEEGNIIETINKETKFDENGIYEIVYENEPEKINIKTSEIKNEGIINIRHTKEIKENAKNVEDTINTNIKINGKEEAYEFKNEIKEATTDITLNVENLNWSNKSQNEVEFDINLKSNTIQNNMFKNPYIKIELPDQVEKIILGESHILYGNELKLEEPYVETNENGKKAIIAKLSGTETQYNENTLDLVTNIKIPATIILNKDFETTKNEKLNITYANQYTIDNTYEIKNEEKELKLENYKEENKKEESTVYDVAKQLLAENSDGLLLEITPTKASTVLENNDVVYEGEYIKYNIKITNVSQEDMQNVRVEATIPEGVTYGELQADYYNFRGEYKYNFSPELRKETIDIGTIKQGETITKFYEVKVDDLAEEVETKQITTTINTYIGEGLAKTYEINNTINKAEAKLFMGTYLDYASFVYYLTIHSKDNSEIETKIHLPKGFEIYKISYVDQPLDEFIFGESTNQHTYKDVYASDIFSEEIENPLEIQTAEDGCVTVKLHGNSQYVFSGGIKFDGDERIVTAYAETTINDKTYLSNENRFERSHQETIISMSSPNEGEEVKAGEEINYEIEIKNEGRPNVSLTDLQYIAVNVVDFLPEEVKPEEIIYNNWELETEDDRITGIRKQEGIVKNISSELRNENDEKLPNIDLALNIPNDESVKILVKTKANYLDEKTKIENSATVEENGEDVKTSNIVSHIILPRETLQDVENPEEPEEPDYKDPEPEPGYNDIDDPNDDGDTEDHSENFDQDINTEDPNNPSDPDNPNNPSNPSNPSDPSNPNNPNNPGGEGTRR